VISLNKPDRVKNIKKQTEIINKMNKDDDINNNNITIHFVDAIVGKDLNLELLVKQNIIRDFIIYDNSAKLFNGNILNRKNEIGCYLSHLKVYDIIDEKSNKNKYGYSIVFEDDFIINDNFLKIVDESITKLQHIDFDLLFLGILGGMGDQVIDNIYKTLAGSYQSHAYLINNRNIKKIKESLKSIDAIIDINIFKKAEKGDLIVFRLGNTIVDQGKYGTDIRNNL